jgi:HTH-type transcriptional regulator, transcriptional repressor of NAD biosynthesis genes
MTGTDMTRADVGGPMVLVVGKFMPLHRGHELLIDRALDIAGTDGRLHVFVNDRPDYPIPAEVRAAWVHQSFPACRVHVANDPWAATDSGGQARNIVRILGRAPDVIVTSEDWADPVSELLGCRHVRVDPSRTAIPISATAIREDPIGNWEMLLPSSQAGLTIRVCVIGSPDLAAALAAHYARPGIPTVTVESAEMPSRRTRYDVRLVADEAFTSSVAAIDRLLVASSVFSPTRW